MQVPRFQRPLVWDWERRRELLRSVREGIPMGALLVWRTNKDLIEGYKKLGPHQLHLPPTDVNSRQYLLDGVQRLSTLYGALHTPTTSIDNDGNEFDEGPEVIDYRVYYDLSNGDFVCESNGEPYMLPLTMLFDSVGLLRFQRDLKGDRSNIWVQEADETAKAFRQYKVPIIPITTDDVDVATKTFQRINSQGMRMSEFHMVHALTWSSSFDFRKSLSRLKREHLDQIGWKDLDDDIVLKCCKAALNLDVYKANAETTSEKLKELPQTLVEVVNSIAITAEFLAEHCNITAPSMVPYGLQIVLLSHGFRNFPLLDDHQKHLLFSWFWMTTYGELFASMSGDRVQVALDDMLYMLDLSIPYWTWKRLWEQRPLGKNFDFRSARVKAFAFRLADARDSIMGDTSGADLLIEVGRRGVMQVIPWSRAGRELYSSPANRFLIHPSELSDFRDRLLSGKISDTEMRIHLISEEAYSYLLSGNSKGFMNERLRVIASFENRFITPLVEPFIGNPNEDLLI